MVRMLMLLKCLNDTSCYGAVISCLWWNLRWYLYCLSHIVIIQFKFMDDCGWLFLMMHIWYVSYMMIFIRTRRRKNLEYKTSLFDKCHLFYASVIMPSKMHKFHMVQDSYSSWLPHGILVEDYWSWWYREILTYDCDLMILFSHWWEAR